MPLDGTYIGLLPKDLYPMIIPYFSNMCHEPQVPGWDETQIPTGPYNWMDVFYMIGRERIDWCHLNNGANWIVTERLTM